MQHSGGPAHAVHGPLPPPLMHLCCCRAALLQIQNTKKKTGVIPPKKFVQRLKRDNEQFCSYMHQVHPGRHSVAGLTPGTGLMCSLCHNALFYMLVRGTVATNSRMLHLPRRPAVLPAGRPRVPQLPAQHNG